MVIGPVERSLSYPDHPPRTGAIVQAAQARTRRRIWVFLFARADALQSCFQRVEDRGLPSVKNVRGRVVVICTGASEHELHGHGGTDKCDHGEFFQRGAVLDDALLKANPLAFDGSEELFNMPALAIPADHRQGLGGGIDGVGCQQAPQDRRLAGRSD